MVRLYTYCFSILKCIFVTCNICHNNYLFNFLPVRKCCLFWVFFLLLQLQQAKFCWEQDTQQVFTWRLAESGASKYLFMLERTWQCISSTYHFEVNQACINVKRICSPSWIRCCISDWIAWVSTELVMMNKFAAIKQLRWSFVPLKSTSVGHGLSYYILAEASVMLPIVHNEGWKFCAYFLEVKLHCVWRAGEAMSSSGGTDNV